MIKESLTLLWTGFFVLQCPTPSAHSEENDHHFLGVSIGGAVEQKRDDRSKTEPSSLAAGIQDGSRILKSVVNEKHTNLTRVAFIMDSQAIEAGLGQKVQSQLHWAGIAVTLLPDPAQRLVQSDWSALACLEEYCHRERPDILILWMGVNDLKVQSGQGVNYSKNLTTVLGFVSSSCGSPKVVLVRPPLFTFAEDTEEWPNSQIQHMNQVATSVFATIKRNRNLRIVDAQALSNASDFDRVAHFCIDKRPCKTSAAISKAIVEAVQSLTTQSLIPGLHFLSANAPSNTSTWFKVLAGTAMPLVGLEGAVYALRNAPLEDSVGHGRAWLPLFDVARLLGALHIVTFHLCQNSFEWSGFGKYWLSFFFFVSGFSNSYTAGSQMQGPLANVKHGLSKVYLSHSIGVIIFLMAQWNHVFVFPWYDVLTTLTLTQSVLPPFHSSLNGPAWFLSTLMVLWLLAPHWHNFLGRLTQAQRLLLLGFCWLATLMPPLVCNVALNLNLNLGGDVPQLVEFHFVQRWQLFLGGMVFEHLARGQEITRFLKVTCMVCLLAGLGGISQMSPPGFEMDSHYMLFDHGFATFPFICAFSTLALAFSTESTNPMTKWAGLLALPIYILHVPLRALFELVGGSSTTFCAVLLLCSVGLVILEQHHRNQARANGSAGSAAAK